MGAAETKDEGVILDLDHFTVIHKGAGHGAGDDVLRQIGWAARLGGDEFAVVLPGCSL